MFKNHTMDRNYFYHLIFFIVIFVFLMLIDVAFLNQSFFSIAYFWHTLLAHPGIKDRAESKRYRYSFIKYVYLTDCYLQSIYNKNNQTWITRILHALEAFGFVLMLFFIGGMGNPFFSLLGSIVYQGLAVVLDKLQLKWPPDRSD